MCQTSPAGQPLLVAHRGASFEAPENTQAAVRLGWQQSDACEIDVHLSQDSQVVVLHDASTKRTAGLDREVKAQTLAELKQLNAGSWKGPQWQGEKIPTLAEVLDLMPEGKKLVIEIKTAPEILPALEQVLQTARKKPGQLILIAFNFESIRLAKKLFPDHEAYWLAAYKKDSQTGQLPEIDDLIAQAKAAGLDGLNLDFNFPIDAAFTDKIKKAGLKFFVWTVDDPDIARKLAKAGVDGITTNRPAWLAEKMRD